MAEELPKGKGNADVADSAPRNETHADNELACFDRYSFPYRELYGDGWDENFNPLYRNILTKTGHSSGHHARGAGARTRAHFDLSSRKAKYAFCLTHDTVTRADGSTERVRCSEVFLIDSGGCGKPGHGNSHQKDGPNSIFQKMLRGETVSRDVLKDPEEKQKKQVKDPKQIEREAAEASSAVLQDQFDQNGFVDPNAVTNVFEQRKQEEKIKAKTERQRAKTTRQGGSAQKARLNRTTAVPTGDMGNVIEEETPPLSEADIQKAAAAAARLEALAAKAKNGGRAPPSKSVKPGFRHKTEDEAEGTKPKKGFGRFFGRDRRNAQ